MKTEVPFQFPPSGTPFLSVIGNLIPHILASFNSTPPSTLAFPKGSQLSVDFFGAPTSNSFTDNSYIFSIICFTTLSSCYKLHCFRFPSLQSIPQSCSHHLPYKLQWVSKIKFKDFTPGKIPFSLQKPPAYEGTHICQFGYLASQKVSKLRDFSVGVQFCC